MPDKKSKKKSDDETTDEEGGGGGGKSKMLPAAVLSVGLLGGGYFVGGGMGGGGGSAPVAEASGTPVAVEEETKKELGALVPMDAVNVNLADGHFLRIAVTLELSPEKSDYLAEKQSKDSSYAFATAPAADLVLTTFAGRSMEALSSPDGRDEARLALAAAIGEVYHSDVTALYFTEFVMQ